MLGSNYPHPERSTPFPTVIVTDLRPASESGALEAYDVVCSACQVVTSSSLLTGANGLACGHLAWHAMTGK